MSSRFRQGRCRIVFQIWLNLCQKETDYLKSKDKALAEVIDKIGHIEREIDPDLFSAVIHHIIGQQISTKAQVTIWQRMRECFGEAQASAAKQQELGPSQQSPNACKQPLGSLPAGINANNILSAGIPRLQSFGMTFRKAEYITDFARKVQCGEFDLQGVSKLSALKGIGVWTAEMILLFCLERPDIFSFDDLAIQRGLRMVYHHRKIDLKLFEKYRRRFSLYCSVASLYFWAVAGGAVPDMKDYAPKGKKKKVTKGD